MPSAVRSALVRSALERLSGAWLRDAAAFGLLQGRSWVMSWPPGPAPAPPDLTAEVADSPQLALGLVGAKPDAKSRLDADAATIAALIRSERDGDLLAAELVDRQDEILALYDLARSSRNKLDIPLTLQTVAAEMGRLLKADLGFIALLADSPQPQVVTVARGAARAGPRRRLAGQDAADAEGLRRPGCRGVAIGTPRLLGGRTGPRPQRRRRGAGGGAIRPAVQHAGRQAVAGHRRAGRRADRERVRAPRQARRRRPRRRDAARGAGAARPAAAGLAGAAWHPGPRRGTSGLGGRRRLLRRAAARHARPVRLPGRRVGQGRPGGHRDGDGPRRLPLRAAHQPARAAMAAAVGGRQPLRRLRRARDVRDRLPRALRRAHPDLALRERGPRAGHLPAARRSEPAARRGRAAGGHAGQLEQSRPRPALAARRSAGRRHRRLHRFDRTRRDLLRRRSARRRDRPRRPARRPRHRQRAARRTSTPSARGGRPPTTRRSSCSRRRSTCHDRDASGDEQPARRTARQPRLSRRPHPGRRRRPGDPPCAVLDPRARPLRRDGLDRRPRGLDRAGRRPHRPRHHRSRDAGDERRGAAARRAPVAAARRRAGDHAHGHDPRDAPATRPTPRAPAPSSPSR